MFRSCLRSAPGSEATDIPDNCLVLDASVMKIIKREYAYWLRGLQLPLHTVKHHAVTHDQPSAASNISVVGGHMQLAGPQPSRWLLEFAQKQTREIILPYHP
jgi:hypothetical protein